jgi:hypothetical protein
MATAAAASPALAARTPYRVTLHQMECCNCNHGCGCQFAGYPDRGSCEFVIGFEIIDGRLGTVQLAGARGIVVCKYPGAIHQGNGKVTLFLDRALKPEQLVAVLEVQQEPIRDACRGRRRTCTSSIPRAGSCGATGACAPRAR